MISGKDLRALVTGCRVWVDHSHWVLSLSWRSMRGGLCSLFPRLLELSCLLLTVEILAVEEISHYLRRNTGISGPGKGWTVHSRGVKEWSNVHNDNWYHCSGSVREHKSGSCDWSHKPWHLSVFLFPEMIWTMPLSGYGLGTGQSNAWLSRKCLSIKGQSSLPPLLLPGNFFIPMVTCGYFWLCKDVLLIGTSW